MYGREGSQCDDKEDGSKSRRTHWIWTQEEKEEQAREERGGDKERDVKLG